MQIVSVSHSEKIAALSQNAYFAGLSPSTLGDLAQGTTLRRFERGEAVIWQGEPCTGLFILRNGSAKLFKLSAKGRELIIRTIEEGATFSEVPVFDHGQNPVNVAALEESEIWVVEASVIRRALAEHPEMAEAVIQNLAKNLRMLVGIVEELSFCQVTNRLARLISRMPPEKLEEPGMTQDQLAARLGTVREVVARSLKDLERSGAIRVKRRRIQILDEHMLEAWAQEPMN